MSPKENYFDLDEDDIISERNDPELPKKRLTSFNNWSPGSHFIFYNDSTEELLVNKLGIDFKILSAFLKFIGKDCSIVIYNIEVDAGSDFGSRGDIRILIEAMKRNIKKLKSLSKPLKLNACYFEDVDRKEILSDKSQEFFDEIIKKLKIKCILINYENKNSRMFKFQGAGDPEDQINALRWVLMN